MKKQLIAAAVAGAFALLAMAQVTISGSIQSGVMANSGGTQGLIYHTTLTAPASPNQERTLTTLTYANGPITAQYMAGEVQDNGKQNGFGASYDLGFLKANIASAVSENAAGAKTRDMMMYTATMPLRPGLTGFFGYAKDKRQASNANTRWAVGVNYAMSKRTTLGADVFEQEQVGGSTGFVLRARHTF